MTPRSDALTAPLAVEPRWVPEECACGLGGRGDVVLIRCAPEQRAAVVAAYQRAAYPAGAVAVVPPHRRRAEADPRFDQVALAGAWELCVAYSPDGILMGVAAAGRDAAVLDKVRDIAHRAGRVALSPTLLQAQFAVRLQIALQLQWVRRVAAGLGLACHHRTPQTDIVLPALPAANPAPENASWA